MSGNETEHDSAHLAKKLNTQAWVVNTLFMSGNQVGLSPDERVKDANRKLEHAAGLLSLRTKHPELESLFARLAEAHRRAEDRMERFIEIRIKR